MAQISLDESKSGHRKVKVQCPYCQKREKTYVRFMNWQTMQYLPIEFGRCDREINCGAFNRPPRTNPAGIPTRIQDKIVRASIDHYDRNNLALYLGSIFGMDEAVEICARYNIGTASHYPGAAVFWQTDMKGEYRSGKVVGYGENGRRRKGETIWVHKLMNLDPFDLEQCLFGEHLLGDDEDKPVGIFESEKTAVIYELANPDLYICLASGGSNGLGGRSLNHEKVRCLRGRAVTLFPDSSTDGRIYHQWSELAVQMNDYDIDAHCLDWESEICQSQRDKGFDIADLILASQFDSTPEEFMQDENPEKLFYFPL